MELNHCFVIRGLKIIAGEKSTFVSMPNRKGQDGKFRDIAHPINEPMREYMTRVILDEYRRAVAQAEKQVRRA